MAITRIQLGDREIEVDTSIADRLIAANEAKIAATGTPIQVNEGFRSTERQAELYRRSQAGEIGRAAPPGKSFHETGKAVDIADVEGSQKFLNRYGFNNDLEGDRGHFSVGETQKTQFDNFGDSVEKGRQRGITDTKLLDVFTQKHPEMAEKVGLARQRYGSDPNLNNDRDLINFLALKFTGTKLQTPSVPEPEEIKEEVGAEEPGFVDRTKETFKRRGEEFKETFKGAISGELSPPEVGIRTVGDVIGTVFDVGADVVISGIELIPGVEEAGSAILKTDIAQSGLKKLGEGIESYEEWKAESPSNERIGETIESVIDITEAFPGGAVVKKGAKVTKELAEDVVVKGVKPVLGAVEDVAKVTKRVAPKAGEKAGEVATFGVSQATGLTPRTIKRVIAEPQKFTDEILKSVDVETFGKNVIDKIKERSKALSDTGRGYNVIRKDKTRVKIDKDFIADTLKKDYGFDIKDGKLVANTKSLTRDVADINAVQNVLKNWGDKIDISTKEFLNLRNDLTKLSKFDATRTSDSQKIGRDLRANLNKKFRDQIEGLKKVDDIYSEEIGILNGVKKDYFFGDGRLKDNAINKLSNIGNKEPVVKRLEALIPDVKEQLKVLEVVKDIEYASGRAVGTYARSIIGAGGAVSGNVPAMVAAIVATPKIAVPLLRKYGKAKLISKPMIDSISKSLKNGVKLTKNQLVVMKKFLNEKVANVKKWLKELSKNEGGFAKLPGKTKPLTVKETAFIDDFLDKMKADETITKELQLKISEISEKIDLPKSETLDELAGALDDYIREVEGAGIKVLKPKLKKAK